MASAADAAKLASARLLAVHQFPYLARALFALQPRPGIRSMAVDESWRLYVGPEVLSSWTVEECAAVMVHEVTHLVRDHAGRARALGVEPPDRRRWNLAVDLEVDDDLVEAGMALPFGGSQPADHGLEPHQLAETYFRKLGDRASRTCGSGSGGDSAEGEATAEGGLRLVESLALRRQTVEEIRRTVGRGDHVGEGWRRWAEANGRALDWRYELAAVVRASTRSPSGRADYSYSRPSRRSAAARPVILPALVHHTPSVALVVDTSASMSQRHLGAALRETLAIAESVSGRGSAVLISCDTAARVVGEASAGRRHLLAGGGGTDLSAGLDTAARMRPPPDLVVVLTDGHTRWPSAGPRRQQVVVGVIGPGPEGPGWARTVRIAV